MKKLLGVTLAVTMAAAWPANAEAKVGDSAWARCAWDQAPASSAKWLTMPVPTWTSPFTGASSLLGFRLIALCDQTSADPKRPNRAPNWKSVAAALKRSRPKTPRAADAAPSAVAALCKSTVEEGGRTSLFLYEVVRRLGGRQTTIFQQYFTSAGGQPVKLPQDLRILPPPGAKVARNCQSIGAEGELVDA